MELEFCPEESRMQEALKKGALPGELEAHAERCRACTETRLISGFLMAEASGAVPPAGLVYWKAELRARREQGELALRPARRMQTAAAVVLPAMAIAGGAMYSGSAWVPAAAAGFTLLLISAGWAIRWWLAPAR
ncbi:MAG: hypothetical protein IT165_12600 [Bryobacterales bacterium]|nr:hypothetical protein [Bryobacterales bacterium]